MNFQISSGDLDVLEGREAAWSDVITRVLGASQQFMRKQTVSFLLHQAFTIHTLNTGHIKILLGLNISSCYPNITKSRVFFPAGIKITATDFILDVLCTRK